ncbi:unknown protein (plasmid) [Synechocystis sp. PCC 6803]|uniref:Uncharacterized protein n=1 Tax=Synechocystis sp. (strain ATCC 27184 / PCC 6803 / Kazusa) TaxID=1111708 RepID=Q6ZE89_SYNY3|nr:MULTISPECIES: hypothetical protein [unclassified Synechocystis]AGF53663.1 hypothetical protein MYO_540 [Synechocystis sp. PCC 6803]AVP91515.1 hypothetical protein C7I86_17215 [Synechocystis sp. IPPAS B-1465]MBD2619677.1 hypothetical protein [Synechocystis sp. FACHB-898]MBD2640745.1 hypothetical protein [Synechocystis sp. FACHB-908]MBD2662392.1 hypothetical protein [Synechocystis sp. FACHB-929]
MTNQQGNVNARNREEDPDILGSEKALRRAAQRARERAKQAGIGVIILKDGEIVEELPDS